MAWPYCAILVSFVVQVALSEVAFTSKDSATKCHGNPFSDAYAVTITLAGQVVLPLNWTRSTRASYCRPLEPTEADHVRNQVVLVRTFFPRPCTDHQQFHWLNQAGAKAAIAFDSQLADPSRTWFSQEFDPGITYNISEFPVIAISGECGEAAMESVFSGSKVTVQATVSAEDNGYRAMCLPFGHGTITFRVIIPIANVAVMVVSALRLRAFVLAKGVQLSLAQGTLSTTLLVCALNLVTLVPDALMCAKSVYGEVIGQLLLTISIPLMLSCTLTISFYFNGVVTARKGRSPLHRYRSSLALASLFLLSLEVSTSLLRSLVGYWWSVFITSAVYLLIMLTLGTFFIRSSLAVLAAIRASAARAHSAAAAAGGAAATVRGGAGRGGGGGSGSSGGQSHSTAQRRRMARWLSLTGALLLLLAAGAVLFATQIADISAATLYTAWLVQWFGRTAIPFSQMMVFRPPAPRRNGASVAPICRQPVLAAAGRSNDNKRVYAAGGPSSARPSQNGAWQPRS